MTIYKKTGELVLGTRFKRLSDKFLGDVSRVYKSLDISFEPAWFPVFYLLNERGELTVSELATELEITHSGSSQMLNSLEKKGLLEYRQNPKDKRVRTVLLTEKGSELLKRVRPVWVSIKAAMEEILAEGSETSKLLLCLGELEEALQKRNLCDRVIDRFRISGFPSPCVYTQYSEESDHFFRELILDWITTRGDSPALLKDAINNPADFCSTPGNNIVVAYSGKRGTGLIVTSAGKEKRADIELIYSGSRECDGDIENNLVKEAATLLLEQGFTDLSVSLGSGNEKRIALLKDLGFILQNISSDSNENFYINLNMNLKGGN